jgi:uncharacterized phage protein (TIGR02218 family)
MADARLTQTAALALAGAAVSDAARATQAAVLVLAPFAAVGARATQIAALTVDAGLAVARASQIAVLVLADGAPCLTHWALCVKIARRDGTVLAFTDHDEAVLHRGLSHQPCHSLSGSAAELAAVLGAVGNQELAGVLSDEAITEADLFGGLYDGAFVEAWVVPWLNPGREIPWRLAAGTIGKVSQGLIGFTAEVLTAGARLQQQPLLQTHSPGCRFRLGDARCGIDLGALTETGAVTGVAIPDAQRAASRRIFADTSRGEADGTFEHGILTWTSGANAGAASEVKSFVQATGVFILWQAMLHPIAPGDAYEVTPGCDLSTQTCKDKFDNLVNFGGFPDVPGRDAIIESPNAR